MRWFSRQMNLPQGRERRVVVYSQASVESVRQKMQRQVSKAKSKWKQTCWHFSNRRFACEADAQAALERELKGKPAWLDVHSQVMAHPQYRGKGRPSKCSPDPRNAQRDMHSAEMACEPAS